MRNFDIVLLEKPGCDGLTKEEVPVMLSLLDTDSFYPIEILASEHESSAMGFISAEAADKIDYDYEVSGLNSFVADILDDMDKENPDCVYDFNGLRIYLDR